jgi:dTMP kinase
MASTKDLDGAAAVSAARAMEVDAAGPTMSFDDRKSKPLVRGALIVLEGLDRSGKTTQARLLEKRFVELGRKVKVMRFPGEFGIGGLAA